MDICHYDYKYRYILTLNCQSKDRTVSGDINTIHMHFIKYILKMNCHIYFKHEVRCKGIKESNTWSLHECRWWRGNIQRLSSNPNHPLVVSWLQTSFCLPQVSPPWRLP